MESKPSIHQEPLKHSWFIDFFLLLFATKPLTDLFWHTGISVFGQRLDPAAVIGCLFIALPFYSWYRIKQSQAKRNAWAVNIHYAFFALLAFTAIKIFVFGFNDYALTVRIISSMALCTFLSYYLLHGRLPSGFFYIFLGSLLCIIVVAFLQLGHVVPYMVSDTINSVTFGRVTGGYGHPLPLLRVLSYA